MKFKEWLEQQGCTVEIYQEDEGNGYFCMYVTTPDGSTTDVTVTE